MSKNFVAACLLSLFALTGSAVFAQQAGSAADTQPESSDTAAQDAGNDDADDNNSDNSTDSNSDNSADAPAAEQGADVPESDLPNIDNQPIQAGSGGPGRFIPSEQISQDLGVSFPVDI